jgi:hypothetical protein
VQRALALLLCAVAPALVGVPAALGAAVVDQVGWPVHFAEQKLTAKYEAKGVEDAACTPVGAVARRGGVKYYGEFACALQLGDGSAVQIAIRPLTATTFAVLDPEKPRPRGTVAAPPYRGGTGQQMIGLVTAAHVIELMDGSTWKLADPSHEFAGWHVGDVIVIQPGSFYTVVDRTRGQALTGKLLGFGLIDPGTQ